MIDTTKIEWTDYTWSPWWGCTPVSPGCANCYASAIAKRFRGWLYRKGGPRQLAKDWKTPVRWNEDAGLRDERRKVFPSMCDPFDPEVPTEWLARFLGMIAETPNLTWLVLTKRPDNIGTALNLHEFPNVWLGVSIEDQQRADERTPTLLSIPARVRFLSVEPLLGPVDLGLFGTLPKTTHPIYTLTHQLLDWVIVGGESGPNARPCNVEWIRDIVRQCEAAGVACFVKQLGSMAVCDNANMFDFPDDVKLRETDLVSGAASCRIDTQHPKGGDTKEWPRELRVREFPAP